MYALMRLTRKKGGRLRHTLYGVCGSRRLLEKIRAGQEHPEDWRVIRSALNIPCSYGRTWRKAG